MDQLIPLINKLQDAFSLVESGAPVDLPQIVVVGSQSSGKSSVLESIVGRDFLPRGSGIVTRRPLILQLIHRPSTKKKKEEQPKEPKNNDLEIDLSVSEWEETDEDFEEWGEFLHLQGEKFGNFSDIKKEIQNETDRKTGNNKGISPVPINLKIYSPHVVNLTLVDLPGTTRIPVGDQPRDIEDQIIKMIMTFIEKPNSIILAVTAANTDLATSDGLRLAKEVDPEGKRTLGVLTKLDLMDKGTNALEMLLGKVIPLKLGFIAVVNRSQQDINSNKALREHRGVEKEFFKTNPTYRTIADRCGTEYLSYTLNKLLINHIKATLPDLKSKAQSMMHEVQEELKSYGDDLVTSNPGATILRIVNSYSALYSEMIEGRVADKHSVDELYGGARINYIFNDIFGKYLKNLHSLEGLTREQIRTTISNATGPKAALFIPESAFETLVKTQISSFREPCLQCIDLVFDELERLINTIVPPELERFQNLRDAIIEVATSLIRDCRGPTRDMVNNLVNMETCFINTNHPDFKVDEIIGRVTQRRQQSKEQEQAQQPRSIEGNSASAQRNMNQGLKDPLAQPMPSNPPSSSATRPQGQNPSSRSNEPTPSHPNRTQPSQPASTGFFGQFFGNRSTPKENPSPSKPEPSREKDQKASYSSQSSQSSQRMNQAPKRQAQKLSQPPVNLNVHSLQETEQQPFEIELLEGLLETYFNIVRKNFIDAIPKVIMYFMVSRSESEMQNDLIKGLYKEDHFNRLLSESPEIAMKRQTCLSTLKLLEKANQILHEVRDFAIGPTNASGSSSHSYVTNNSSSSSASTSRWGAPTVGNNFGKYGSNW